MFFSSTRCVPFLIYLQATKSKGTDVTQKMKNQIQYDTTRCPVRSIWVSYRLELLTWQRYRFHTKQSEVSNKMRHNRLPVLKYVGIKADMACLSTLLAWSIFGKKRKEKRAHIPLHDSIRLIGDTGVNNVSCLYILVSWKTSTFNHMEHVSLCLNPYSGGCNEKKSACMANLQFLQHRKDWYQWFQLDLSSTIR